MVFRHCLTRDGIGCQGPLGAISSWWFPLRLRLQEKRAAGGDFSSGSTPLILIDTLATYWVMQLVSPEVSWEKNHIYKGLPRKIISEYAESFIALRISVSWSGLATYVVPKIDMCILFCPSKSHVSIIFCYAPSQQSRLCSSVTPSSAACRRNHSGKPHSIPPSWPKVCHTFSHGISSAVVHSAVHLLRLYCIFLSIIVHAVKEYVCPHSAVEYTPLHSADLGAHH